MGNNKTVLTKLIVEIWERGHITKREIRQSSKHKQSDDYLTLKQTPMVINFIQMMKRREAVKL